MNFFEQELRKIMQNVSTPQPPQFFDRACIFRLSPTLVGKVEITRGSIKAEYYYGLNLSVTNLAQTAVDTQYMAFSDALNDKRVYIYKSGYAQDIYWKNGDLQYSVTPRDFKAIADRVSAYFSVFADMGTVSKRTATKQATLKNSKKDTSAYDNLVQRNQAYMERTRTRAKYRIVNLQETTARIMDLRTSAEQIVDLREFLGKVGVEYGLSNPSILKEHKIFKKG